MPGAARLNDMHSCPAQSGNIPHIGGVILGPGTNTVLINGRPAAVVGDTLMCNAGIDIINTGSSTVFIGGRPAARMGDKTAHGGQITTGASNVIIG